MKRNKIISSVINALFYLACILLLCRFSNPLYAEDLRSKIKNAKSFEDIFREEKAFKLEAGKNSFIERVNAMVVADNGDIIINNMGRNSNYVLLFKNDGRYIKELGKKGGGPGEYNVVQSMARDREGNIYLVDQNRRQILIYDKQYIYRKMVQYRTRNQFIHLNKKKEIYLYMGVPLNIPGFEQYDCVEKLGNDGKKITSFALLDNEISKQKFHAMFDCMAIDKNDYIYESNPLRPWIRKYNSDGKLIKEFGEKRIRMISETDKNGNTYEYPRIIESFTIFRDIIIIWFGDGKADFYDTEGNLLNKNIPVKYTVRYADDNYLYLVESGENMESPILHKYAVK